jgi:hypothetical protein
MGSLFEFDFKAQTIFGRGLKAALSVQESAKFSGFRLIPDDRGRAGQINQRASVASSSI